MIRRPEVRVINPEGKQLGIYPVHQALSIALELGLDLVEINPKSNPPVCRIMDFGKFKYEQKKQANLAKKKQKVIEIKEVKFRPKTDDHDFDTKVKHVRRFLEEGNKAKITIRFRGREMAHPEMAAKVLDRVVEFTRDIAVVEQAYRMEGRTMTMVLGPLKGAGSPATSAGPAQSVAQTTAGALEALGEAEDDVDDDDDDDDDDDLDSDE
jgi:translation initiation factor IF-3